MKNFEQLAASQGFDPQAIARTPRIAERHTPQGTERLTMIRNDGIGGLITYKVEIVA